MKPNVQEDAEMEGFATKDMSVNVLMDFMGLIVKKVIKKKKSAVFFTTISRNLYLLHCRLS